MPAPARRRSDKQTRTPMTAAPPIEGSSIGVSHADIARRAFERYCERGRADGHDLDDWLQAERELRGGAESAAA